MKLEVKSLYKGLKMKKFSYIALFFLYLFVSSIHLSAEACQYKYNNEKTTLEFTAFKFTEKTGVKGKIEKFTVTKTREANSILGVFQKLEFTIFPDSVNSGVPDRDNKIRTLFLGSILKNKEITGNVSNISGGEQGKANLNLSWNGVKKTLPVTYSISEGSLEVKGIFSVLDFNLKEGLGKLNQACDDLHKGADGVSKLWPDVEFRIVSALDSSCN